MEEVTERGPSIEDGDPFVVAAERLSGSADVMRRPGVVAVCMPSKRPGGVIRTVRSRFDGNYGNICRIFGWSLKEQQAKMTFAPASEVLKALSAGDPALALEALFDEWLKKGDEK